MEGPRRGVFVESSMCKIKGERDSSFIRFCMMGNRKSLSDFRRILTFYFCHSANSIGQAESVIPGFVIIHMNSFVHIISHEYQVNLTLPSL
jgi:hypothetical protein